MSTATPQEKTLKRVLLVSAIDGWSVIVIAGLGILLTLLLGDLSGLLVGGLVLVAGIIELRGRRRLQRRDADGMKLLVRAQLLLLAVILIYCASRLGSYDQESMLANLTPDMQAVLKESGVEVADILPLVQMVFMATYSLVALLTLLFQGGLVLYYRSRTPIVTAALTDAAHDA
jgi:uncharacterized membrane protein HdeD (DUF308 family)